MKNAQSFTFKLMFGSINTLKFLELTLQECFHAIAKSWDNNHNIDYGILHNITPAGQAPMKISCVAAFSEAVVELPELNQ
jgi:hypothetical protein